MGRTLAFVSFTMQQQPVMCSAFGWPSHTCKMIYYIGFLSIYQNDVYMYEVRFARNRVPGFFTDFEGSKSASKYSYTEIRYKTTLIITL